MTRLLLLLLYLACIATMTRASFDMSSNYEDWLWFLPSHIYENYELNVFGCILTFLLLIVIDPIYTIIAMIIGFIYWILHVGRN